MMVASNMRGFPPGPTVQHPFLHQEWRNLTFLHWSFSPAAIRPFLPREFELDTFDGQAWIGVVPFVIRGSRFPGVPWRLDFPETNVRTYVRGPDGETGVWFFSLDAANLLAVLGARAAFGLPYMWSRMRVERTGCRIRYASERVWPNAPAALECAVETGETVPAREIGPLEVFLLNRYRLYTRLLGRVACGVVDHFPYPLARVQLLELRQSLFAVEGSPIAVHYSPGVEVRISAPRPLFSRAEQAARLRMGADAVQRGRLPADYLNVK
jgi:uncharacterized protein YqjF (DUF2071 family)